MDIEKLRALRTAADTGSITRAAARLGYSQPGLTGMLNRLEQEIGYPLLRRGSGGVSLTPEGRPCFRTSTASCGRTTPSRRR